MYLVLELAPLTFVQYGVVIYREGRARVSLRQKPAENAAGLTKRRLNIKVFHNLEIIFQRRHGKGVTVVAKVNNLRQRFTKVYVVGLRNGSANLQVSLFDIVRLISTDKNRKPGKCDGRSECPSE